jgi:K+-H+ exchange-related protein
MDVFLVPVAHDRYELYCEEPEPPQLEAAPTGFFRRIAHRFSEMVAEAEQERRTGAPAGAETTSWAARVRRRVMRWVAESIAEQRLLWLLRRQQEVAFVHPDDLTEVHAREILRRRLTRDFERHRFWLALNGLGLIASAALTLLPGPNLIAYYFAFRIGGHYLSVRGARQGLRTVTWQPSASAPLSALRGIAADPPHAREARLRELANLLHLEHFASFFQRAAVP